MSISLTKGGNVSLTKEAPGVSAMVVGLGWDARTTTGTDFDLDASAIGVNAAGTVATSRGTSCSSTTCRARSGAIRHTGDNLTGAGDGDDEQIVLNLAGMPAEVDKVVFPVSIYDGDGRGQSFGQVRNAFIRIVNQGDGSEITPATTCPRTPAPRQRWSSVRCTATEPSGSSAPSVRATARGSQGIAKDYRRTALTVLLAGTVHRQAGASTQ